MVTAEAAPFVRVGGLSQVIYFLSKELIKQGKKVYQFGFGQSPFPVPEKIVEALKNNADRNTIDKIYKDGREQ